MKTTPLIALSLAALALAAAPLARAQAIIADPGFDDATQWDGLTGGSVQATGGNPGGAGVLDTGDGGGAQAKLRTVARDAALLLGCTYNFTADIAYNAAWDGNGGTDAKIGFVVRLFDATGSFITTANLTARHDGAAGDAYDTFAESVVLDQAFLDAAGASNAAFIQPMIRIFNANGGIALVDNFQVAVAPIPEPTGAALAALALGTLALRRRR